jgi:hypothetical protein
MDNSVAVKLPNILVATLCYANFEAIVCIHFFSMRPRCTKRQLVEDRELTLPPTPCAGAGRALEHTGDTHEGKKAYLKTTNAKPLIMRIALRKGSQP